MTYQESLDYINSSAWFCSEIGLDRMREFLDRLGSPEKDLKTVHIAGTNGKGSCAAMMASVLKTSGYKTGLFTSPYLHCFNERMQINGKQIENDVLADTATKIRSVADAMPNHPTAFEMMTACALLWFSAEHCDIVVLEVGLGGRYDATNVIPCPEAAVIMNIGLDHTQILGSTISDIAAEKAGIIKPGCDCVCYQQENPDASSVIRAVCEKQNAEYHEADFSRIIPEFDSLDGQVFSYKGLSYPLPLLGAYQRRNAAVVIETAEVLRAKGWKIEQSDLEHGLYAVSWPARFEVLSDDPYFVLDGGHNPQCAEEVLNNLQHYFPDQKHVLLVGVLRDKDYMTLFSILDRTADEYICISPASPRALPAEELASFLKKYGKPVTFCSSVEQGVFEAIQHARGISGMICAVGSLYMAGDIRYCMGCY